MNHENVFRNDGVVGPSDRLVGFLFAVVFLVIGTLPLLSMRSPRWWAIAVSLAFAVLAVAIPRVLAPLNRLWMKFGELLHRVVSPVALGVMFFTTVTPTGFIMRAVGKDPLRLRREPGASTYWIPREPPGPRGESLKDQF